MPIAALDRAITTEADDGAALTSEARQQQEAEVMGDLLSAERATKPNLHGRHRPSGCR